MIVYTCVRTGFFEEGVFLQNLLKSSKLSYLKQIKYIVLSYVIQIST